MLLCFSLMCYDLQGTSHARPLPIGEMNKPNNGIVNDYFKSTCIINKDLFTETLSEYLDATVFC